MNFLLMLTCIFATFQDGFKVPKSFCSSELRVPEIQEELQVSRSQLLELTQVFKETNNERNRLNIDLDRLSNRNSPAMERLAKTEFVALFEKDLAQVKKVLDQRQIDRLDSIREWISLQRSSRLVGQPLILALNQEAVYERLELERKFPKEFRKWGQECQEFLKEKLADSFLAALKPEGDKLRAVENRELQCFDVQEPFRSFDFLIFLASELRQGPLKLRSLDGSGSPAIKRINELVQEYMEVMYVEQPDGEAKSIFGSLAEQYEWEESKLESFHPELIELLGEETYRDMAMRYLDWQLNGIRTGFRRMLSRDLARFLGIQDKQIEGIEKSIFEAKELFNQQYEALQREQFREYRGLLSRKARQKFDNWLRDPPSFMLRYYHLLESKKGDAR